MAKKIAIIGSGYVGLVTGACLAEIGNKVICVDNDATKISGLKKGRVSIYEPGLELLIRRNIKRKLISFSTHIKEAVEKSEVIFIAVGTPSMENGEADLTGIENVARNIALYIKDYRLIVEKSTVPVETCGWVKRTITTYIKNKTEFDVSSNPEFLREGSAINDFMHPDRIVIGVESKRAADILATVYKPIKAPFVVTNIKSAELIKHASNAFLATKISFINAIAHICEKVGADVKEVAQGMGLDKRIGSAFLNAGLGYGGSCFPKDLDAFISIAHKLGYNFDLLKTVRKVNDEQKELFLHKIKNALWIIKDKTVAILGLSFKPNTDDIRNAPSLHIIEALHKEGARVKAYDPQAMKRTKGILKNVTLCKNAYEACKKADCLLLITEWEEFRKLDFNKVKKLLNRPLIIDGRNMLDPDYLKKMGFVYIGIGRGATHA